MGKTISVMLAALVLVSVLAFGASTGVDGGWLARLLGNDVAIAEHEAERAHAEYMASQEARLLKEAEVALQQVVNEGMLYRASAQAITLQSRAHVMLQGAMVLFSIAGLVAGGLLVAVLIKERYA